MFQKIKFYDGQKPMRSSLQNLAVSYECALAIGNSLNLSEMLHEVIHTIVHKTNAHRGIIWVKNKKQELQPVAIAGINIGDVLIQSEIMDFRNVLNQIQKRQQFVLKYKDDKDFLQYCPVLTEKEESVLIVPVTNVAILHLVYASRKIADEPLANLLASLSKKLSVAIEACKAHENIIKEIQVREKTEKELTKKTEQLISSQKKLQGLYRESEQARKSLLSILEDVAQKEEDLKDSESKLNSILSSIDDPVFVFDQDDRFTLTQNSTSEQLYLTPDEFIGKKPSEVMPPHLNKIFSDAFDKIRKLQVAEYDYWLKIRSKTRWFSAKHSPRFIDGKLIGSVAVVRDITERKQAEKMEAAYSDILIICNKTLDLHTIFTEGLDSLMKYIDAQAGAVYLYDPDSKMIVPNVTAGMEKTVVEQDFSPGEGIVGKAAQEQEMIVVTGIPKDTTYTIKSGSNHIIPATIISTPMIFKNTLLGVVVTCHNKSIPPDVLIFLKRVIDQYAVAVNNANTFMEVQEMAARLRNQRDELEMRSHELEIANQTKSEFLANMSHELRTPLNSIIGFSYILHDETVGPLSEKQSRYIGNVLASGKHLLRLINGILDLAKVEAGKMELIYDDFNVSAVIEESIILLSSVALKKNITLNTAVDKELTTINADMDKFKQILYNLISNAIKFTPNGGSVTVVGRRGGNMSQIKVIDTGIGISKEDQVKLFNPFVQLDASASREYEGTGLGLILVKRYVEMHGGKVWIESEPDKGSKFIFTIPVKKK
jgi:PAS domain S-box-containing protein